ncbi:MAG: bifunctional phosphoglucose/phosphomannose isomerase [Candidatus Bathyarchaeia archaeon]|jgi:glucose/mannose-6-phosphate isomerase
MKSAILDEIEKIKALDKGNMINFCINSAKLYGEGAKLAEKIKVSYPKPDNIVVAGMGGSGIGGDLLKDWAKTKIPVPIEVNREYQLPQYAGKKTLVLITSYSGETEESLGAFLDALKRKCMIFCVSSGGALLENAERLRVPYLRVPRGVPPRAALPYLFVPLLIYLEKTGLAAGASEELNEALKFVEKISKDNSPEKPAKENFSKTLALDIGQTAPAVYGFGIYRSVAMRFKQQFNENSKVPAKWEVFSELNHNEIVGWENAGELGKCFSTIFIRDKEEPTEIRSRIEITKKLVAKAGLAVFEVPVQGKSSLAKMLSTVCIGDFTSVYLAFLRGVDPTPVKTINYLKDTLKQNGVKEKIISELSKLN